MWKFVIEIPLYLSVLRYIVWITLIISFLFLTSYALLRLKIKRIIEIIPTILKEIKEGRIKNVLKSVTYIVLGVIILIYSKPIGNLVLPRKSPTIEEIQNAYANESTKEYIITEKQCKDIENNRSTKEVYFKNIINVKNDDTLSTQVFYDLDDVEIKNDKNIHSNSYKVYVCKYVLKDKELKKKYPKWKFKKDFYMMLQLTIPYSKIEESRNK